MRHLVGTAALHSGLSLHALLPLCFEIRPHLLPLINTLYLAYNNIPNRKAQGAANAFDLFNQAANTLRLPHQGTLQQARLRVAASQVKYKPRILQSLFLKKQNFKYLKD